MGDSSCRAIWVKASCPGPDRTTASPGSGSVSWQHPGAGLGLQLMLCVSFRPPRFVPACHHTVQVGTSSPSLGTASRPGGPSDLSSVQVRGSAQLGRSGPVCSRPGPAGPQAGPAQAVRTSPDGGPQAGLWRGGASRGVRGGAGGFGELQVLPEPLCCSSRWTDSCAVNKKQSILSQSGGRSSPHLRPGLPGWA